MLNTCYNTPIRSLKWVRIVTESRRKFWTSVRRILYYFDRFGRPVSHGEWPWPKSVGCPASQRRWPSLKGQKIGQIFKISAGRPNSGQVLAEILHLSQGIFKLANAKISATLVPCPTPSRIDRNSTVHAKSCVRGMWYYSESFVTFILGLWLAHSLSARIYICHPLNPKPIIRPLGCLM